jgi:hypothetical protein
MSLSGVKLTPTSMNSSIPLQHNAGKNAVVIVKQSCCDWLLEKIFSFGRWLASFFCSDSRIKEPVGPSQPKIGVQKNILNSKAAAELPLKKNESLVVPNTRNPSSGIGIENEANQPVPSASHQSVEKNAAVSSDNLIIEEPRKEETSSFHAYEELQKAVVAKDTLRVKALLERFPTLAYIRGLEVPGNEEDWMEAARKLDEQLMNIPVGLRPYLKTNLSVDCSFLGAPAKEWEIAPQEFLELSEELESRFYEPLRNARETAQNQTIIDIAKTDKLRSIESTDPRKMLWLHQLKKLERSSLVGFQFNHYDACDVQFHVNKEGRVRIGISPNSLFSSSSFNPCQPFVLFISQSSAGSTSGHTFTLYFDLTRGICELFDSSVSKRGMYDTAKCDANKRALFLYVLRALSVGEKSGFWKLPESFLKSPSIKFTRLVERRLQCPGSDQFCQTWVCAYIYLRLVLQKSAKEVQDLFHQAIDQMESGRDIFAGLKLLLQILDEIQERNGRKISREELVAAYHHNSEDPSDFPSLLE